MKEPADSAGADETTGLKTQYRLIATPAMKVQARTYPDNLGHQGSVGCFRCHDGGQYLVVKGRITNEKIPSECSTCHPFPQIGTSATSSSGNVKPVSSTQAPRFAEFPLGARPADHKDKLYTFNHRNAAKSLGPAGTTCAACHTRSYCANCHGSGAVKVKHDNMLYDHADAIKSAGGTQSCAFCHQPITCSVCHKEPVPQTKSAPTAIKARRTT